MASNLINPYSQKISEIEAQVNKLTSFYGEL